MIELGKLLRSLRGKESLRSVAERTGLSHSYISDIEKGYRRGTKTPIHPSVDTLKRLASAYNYPQIKLLNAAGYLEDETDKNKLNTSNKSEPYDALREINKLVKKYGIEQMGFFDIEDWKKLGPEDIKMLEKQFKLIVDMAEERNEEKGS